MILKKEKNSRHNIPFTKYEKNKLPRQITQNDRKNTKGNGMEKHLQTSQSSAEATQVAYIAGLFDGEGSVDYAKRWGTSATNKKRYLFRRISCEMSMTEYEVLKWVHQTLGFGRLGSKKVPEGRKPQWRWTCCFRYSYKFAQQILPYAKVKHKKLKQIIDHYDEGT